MRYTKGDVEWRGREEDEREEKRAKEKKKRRDMLLLLTWRKEQIEEVKFYEYGRSDGGIGVYGHVMGNGLFYPSISTSST